MNPELLAWAEGVRERIRRIRADAGLSAREAGERCGVPFANLNKIETGKTAIPTIEFLFDIAKGYGVPFQWLMFGGETPKGGKKK
ncbi:helix-turn-helix domain-containing protein [Fimbriiglobus ruber]|uniref:helix-turn-helix domain-containing protein n=1 Tax=Fimbriiglobus ruber TaxID=1908690 RepID=UPI00137ADCA0|nr:helix-turn-helix transcriptional regulator [Fimbriiglobus ruber]